MNTETKAKINRLQEVAHYANEFVREAAAGTLNDEKIEGWLITLKVHADRLQEGDLTPYYDEEGEYIS